MSVQEQFRASAEEAAQSALSLGLSATNGVFALAGAMAGRGLLSKTDVDFLHDNMLRPLTNEGGVPELLALQMRRLDELCGVMSKLISERDR